MSLTLDRKQGWGCMDFAGHVFSWPSKLMMVLARDGSRMLGPSGVDGRVWNPVD